MLNLFCIQIQVWVRSHHPQPSLTPQSWSWKEMLNIWAFPWFSQGCAFWEQVRPRAPQQWTWSKALIFSCVASDPLSYWVRCHKPRTARLSDWIGSKPGITSERISWEIGSINRQIDLLCEYFFFPFYLLHRSFSPRKFFTVLGRWEWPLGNLSSDILDTFSYKNHGWKGKALSSIFACLTEG